MRFSKGSLVGLVAVGLVACSSAASGPSASKSPVGGAKTNAGAAQSGPVQPDAQVGARAAAVRFDGLYTTGQFAASWALLAPTAKREVPQDVWVKVHEGCSSATVGKSRVIKTVTVFGNAAIVTVTTAGNPVVRHNAEEVFSYNNGRWGYSPNDLRTYHYKSIKADIAAAEAAGYCASWKNF